jgi:hypothetical protein
MSDEKEVTRKDAFTRGYETAMSHAQILVSMGIDASPSKPSPQTLALLLNGKTELAAPFMDLLADFRKRVASDLKKKNGEAAAA